MAEMTYEDLRNEYLDGELFKNQFELGKFLHEYGVRNKVEHLIQRWPGAKIKDTEIYYDVAELALKKGVAFFNDGCYIIEDLAEIEQYI